MGSWNIPRSSIGPAPNEYDMMEEIATLRRKLSESNDAIRSQVDVSAIMSKTIGIYQDLLAVKTTEHDKMKEFIVSMGISNQYISWLINTRKRKES